MVPVDTLAPLRASLPYRAIGYAGPHKVFRRPPRAKRPTFWVTGGLGDMILSIPVVEGFQASIGERVEVFTRYPSVWNELSDVRASDEKEFIKQGRDWWITLNTLVMFNFQKNFRGFTNPVLNERLLDYRSFICRDDWAQLVDKQPHLENLTGSKAVSLGLNRATLPFRMLGLFPVGVRRQFRIRQQDVNTLAPETKKFRANFITVHDGFDDANAVNGRSMKNWNLASWSTLIEGLRKEFPGFDIVQLGGKNSRQIRGTINLSGRLDLVSSLKVLQHSSLHIDTESGLVHAARLMGVESVVMFGPTNINFFGHQENRNIAPSFCGGSDGCWWLKADWMSRCVLGYGDPLCMDSIKPERVLMEAKEALGGRIRHRS